MNTLRDPRLETAAVYTDLQGLGELREAVRQQSPEALRGVASQFEALFIGMMLDSMRGATETLDSGLFGSQESELYQQLFDRQIAQKIASGRGLGIADALERQLSRIAAQQQSTPEAGPAVTRQEASDVKATPSGMHQVSALQSDGDRDLVVAPAVTVAAPQSAGFGAATPSEFVASVLPHAQRVAVDLGIHPLAIVAQAALETGWGRHLPRQADGASSFNFFGIKAGQDWSGSRITRTTMEYTGGALRRETAQFRAYDNMAEAFDDYARLLKRDPRYRAALSAGADPGRFAERLQAGGYATDPRYADKVRAILRSPVLQQVMNSGGSPTGAVET